MLAGQVQRELRLERCKIAGKKYWGNKRKYVNYETRESR
jgi:hypothetical protein